MLCGKILDVHNPVVYGPLRHDHFDGEGIFNMPEPEVRASRLAVKPELHQWPNAQRRIHQIIKSMGIAIAETISKK